ncbi:hypothetical protein ACEWPM_013215 [Roseovarius sp. S4756]|uniref:hypothetical protein n=1 Tax=Roseovarius maritimus TaxID=3342637 RepID=UPI00372B325E
MRDLTAKELLVIHIEIGRPTIDWAFGKQLLDLFFNFDHRLAPKTLSVWGEKVANLSGSEDVRPHWAGLGQMRVNGSLSEFHVGIGWHRKLTTMYHAEIQHESQNIRGRLIPAKLSVYAKPHRAIDWRGFTNLLFELTEAQYGFAHLHRDAHLRTDLSEAREPIWITGDRTSKTVPQLGWSTFLGRPYVDIVSPLSDQIQDVEIAKIGDGYAITLTDSILDVADRYEEFNEIRSKVKTCFPRSFFDIL